MPVERIPITDRAAWLAMRAQDITASDVPAVCGEGVYGSAARVWAEKRGLIAATELTEAMKRGLWGEAAVFEALAWEYPDWEIRRAKVYLRDPAARLGATPDGVASAPDKTGIGIIQTKVVSRNAFAAHWLETADDNPHDLWAPARPPLGFELQTLTEAMLAEADWAAIAALITDQWRWTLRLFDVARHPRAEAAIRATVAAFWKDYLDPGIAPPLDPARDADLVRQLYPRDDGSEIDLSGDNYVSELVEQWGVVKTGLKQLDGRKRQIETELKDKLAEHAYGRLADGQRLSWKLQERDGYQVAPTSFRVLKLLKAFKREHHYDTDPRAGRQAQRA
jgi:hypothetical protein